MKHNFLKFLLAGMALLGTSINIWALDSHFSIVGNPTGGWDKKVNLDKTYSGRDGEFYTAIYIENNQYFALHNGSSQYGPNTNNSAIKNGSGGGQGTYNSNAWKFTGTNGLVMVCAAENNDREWYPYVYVEEHDIKLKHPWDGSSWSWSDAMTNKKNGTYELTATIKGASTGYNYGDGSNEYGWIATPTCNPTTIADGSKCLIVLDAKTFKITVTRYQTITYNINGGSGASAPSAQEQLYNQSITLAAMPSGLAKTGYNFTGWNTASDGTGDHYAAGETISNLTSDLTLYAEWTEKTFTVTAAKGTGCASVNPTGAQTVGQLTGKQFTATASTGYSFDSWTSNNGGTFSTQAATTTFKPTGAATITANFTEVLTSVTISSNGNGTVSPTSASVGVATTESVSATPADGYHFASWAVTGNADIKGATTSNPVTLYGNGSGSIGTLKATFAETLYTITIESGTAASTTAGCVTTGTATAAAAAEGKKFDKWDLGTGITLVDGCAVTDQTITFHASQAATVTATYTDASKYNLNVVAGTGIENVTGSKTDQTVLPFSSDISATVKTGYNFVNWTASGDGTATFTDATATSTHVTVNNGSVTVTANAVAHNYNLTYTNVEPSEHTNPATYTVEDAFEFTAPSAREGYTFAGWSPASITKGTTGNKTVTASWTLNHHTLTWNLDGGSITTPGTSAGEVDYGTALVAPVVEKTGYTFAGWNPSVAATMPDNNVTYTATWTENKTAVTVSSNNTTWGTVSPASANVGVTTTANLTATPKPGYKFVTWELANCVLVTGSLTNAQITIKGDGSSANGTAVATFAEDLTANWYIEGEKALLTKCTSDWQQKNANYRFSKPSKDASSAYIDIEITQAQVEAGKEYQFKLRDAGVGGEPMYGWGTNGDDHHTFIATETFEIYNNEGKDHNLRIKPSIAGTYRFSIDWSENKKRLTVTWPSVNDLHHNFTGEWTHTAGTVVNGVLTANYEITQAMVDSKSNLEFEIIYEGVYYGPGTDKAQMTATNHTDWKLEALGHGYHVVLKPSIAGIYTFVFDSKAADKNFNVTYPIPDAPASINVTAERYFGEEKIDNFIATDPAYKVYTDEKIVLTIAAVAAPTGCTTYYQFGENAASTERTYIISNITNIASSIDAKVFFRPNAGGKDGDAKSETINYIGVFAPSINLTTSWKDHNEEAQEGVDVPDDVTIYYNAANYIGSAIVTRKQDNLEPETFMTIASGEQANKTYTLENQNVQRQTFVATATVNGRTFTATKSISVYRLVEITITDANNLMANYYMWEDGTNPTRKEAEWPGNSFFSTLGNAHIFYVKYPSYTHFVLNNGRQAGEGDAIQTVNIELPNQSTCYTIGEQIAEEGENKGKYNVEIAQTCPNKLYVGDIAPVAALQGEGVLVSPQVDIDPLLNADDLRITFNYKSATGITCDQRGRNFMVTATSTGTKSISVTYSIDGANHVTKDVTVNVTSAIMVQVKVPTSFNWNDHNDMWVYYFGHGAEGHIRMSWKDCVGSHDRFSARVPLGTDDNKVNFLFHEWTLDGKKPWQQTTDITDVTTDGCYTLKHVKDGDKRGYEREDENCWTEYYVEIDMNSGTVYRSNKVEDLANTVSFYAPTSDKGSIRIMQNGTQKTVISPSDHQTLFATAGVYTAKITTDGTGLSDVTPYTGDYYIRTDAATTTASGDDFSDGWSNYKNDNHKFSQFTLFDDALYDYYWVNNCKRTKGDGKLNIKGCVANDYNDNLANMIESDTYTDDDGFLQGNNSTGINLRFGYNPATNYFERAALTGSTSEGGKFLNIIGENVYNKQNRQEELNETNYNDHPDYSKMEDDGDWIYEKTVFVNIDPDHSSSQIYLKSLINSKELYQLGYKTDNFGRKTSELKKRTIMGQGSSNGEYALRIVYDFKQNRILSSWSPIGELKVTKDLMINADVMFIRHENGGTAHIIFENKSAKVTSLQNVYFVLELDKYVGEENERNYWFTVPFDVKVGDIFGVENYVTLDADNEAIDGSWGILRYDGYTRSKKGWFIEDTPEGFWEWMDKDEVLTAGTGYVLVFDKKDFEWKEFDEVIPCDDLEDPQCEEGKKTIKHAIKRIYFPSQAKGFSMSNASENPITYADESCTITKPVDRTKEDSNWKVIGPMSYNDIKVAESDVDTYEGGKVWPNFLYLYDEKKEKGSRYTPTQGYGEDFTYQAFHGYMTQYAGRIIWKDMSVTNPSSAPRFAEEPEFKGGTMTIELVQNNEQLDRTFVKLSKNGTEGFDQNLDLMKITDKCAQIASVSEDALYAGNTLPLDIEMVPLNVKVVANGTYDIALVQSLEGLEVRLLDAFEQTTTVLDMMPATVTLNKGEYKDRFFLQFVQKSPLTPTNFNGTIDQFNLPTDKTQKLLINDNIYLINGGRIYNVLGVGE